MTPQTLQTALRVLRPWKACPMFIILNGCFQAETSDGETWARYTMAYEHEGPDVEMSANWMDCDLVSRSASGDVDISTIPQREYPRPGWPQRTGGDTVTVHYSELVSLAELFPYASRDDKRFNLTGIYFDRNKHQAVATDGHRMTTKALTWLPEGQGCTVPVKSLRSALDSFKAMKYRGEVILHFGGEYLWLEIPETLEICIQYLIIGDYPNYETFIPDHHDKATFGREDFLHTLRLMKIMTSARNKGIGIYLCHDGACFHVVHPDLGIGETWIPGQVEEALIGNHYAVNVDYLMEACKTGNGTVELKAGPESTPMLVNGNLVMPMRGWNHGIPGIAAKHQAIKPITMPDLFAQWEEWAA